MLLQNSPFTELMDICFRHDILLVLLFQIVEQTVGREYEVKFKGREPGSLIYINTLVSLYSMIPHTVNSVHSVALKPNSEFLKFCVCSEN